MKHCFNRKKMFKRMISAVNFIFTIEIDDKVAENFADRVDIKTKCAWPIMHLTKLLVYDPVCVQLRREIKGK